MVYVFPVTFSTLTLAMSFRIYNGKLQYNREYAHQKLKSHQKTLIVILIARHVGGIETEKYITFRNCCTNLCHKMSVDTVISACNALLGSGIWGSILKAIKCIKQCQQNIIFRIYTALKIWHHKISTLRIRSLWFVTDSRGLCFHTEYNNKGIS